MRKRRESDVYTLAAIAAFGIASMGQQCDTGRACPTGMQPAPGVGVEEIINALKSGNPTEEPLCECRPGFEPNSDNWLDGCSPVQTPVTTTTTTTTTPPQQPTPTATPTPVTTPTPSPTPTATPPVVVPTPPPCVDAGGWFAGGITGDGDGCGPTAENRCFRTMQAACNKRLETVSLPMYQSDGRAWYWWGPARKWISDECQHHDGSLDEARGRISIGRKLSNEGYFGIELTPGYEPCPKETPTPTPEAPADCHYTHFNLVWLCAQPSKPGCLDGKDWGRPGVVHIRRDGKPICDGRQCVRAFLTAVLFNGSEKIEAGHACSPGPIPEGSWGQTYPPDMRFDCGEPWGEGWNNGSCNVDFAACNDFRLDAFGVSGTTTMCSDWR